MCFWIGVGRLFFSVDVLGMGIVKLLFIDRRFFVSVLSVFVDVINSVVWIGLFVNLCGRLVCLEMVVFRWDCVVCVLFNLCCNVLVVFF